MTVHFKSLYLLPIGPQSLGLESSNTLPLQTHAMAAPIAAGLLWGQKMKSMTLLPELSYLRRKVQCCPHKEAQTCCHPKHIRW
jgi:hypothetical protein